MEDDSHSSQTEQQETEPQNHSKFTKSLQASCGGVDSRKTRVHAPIVLCALCPRLDAKLLSSRGSHRKQPLYSCGVEELKDLCSQLHAAAGYCESSFLNSNKKHLVVESTKEYVCRAVVAVVDHLGSVSANLDHHISGAELDTVSQSEVRINLLKQKLCITQEYSDKLALAKLTWRPNIPRYNSRYLKPPVSDVLIQNSSSEIVANTENNKHGFKIDEEVPLFFYTSIYKSSPQYGEYGNDDKANVSLSLSALPVRDNLSNQPKPQVPSFQLQEKRTNRRGAFSRKSMTSSEILSIIRRRK